MNNKSIQQKLRKDYIYFLSFVFKSFRKCACKALDKLGIVVETFVIFDVSSDVSLFAHSWKHCCGNKI
jgi:hypothetical protein